MSLICYRCLLEIARIDLRFELGYATTEPICPTCYLIAVEEWLDRCIEIDRAINSAPGGSYDPFALYAHPGYEAERRAENRVKLGGISHLAYRNRRAYRHPHRSNRSDQWRGLARKLRVAKFRTVGPCERRKNRKEDLHARHD